MIACTKCQSISTIPILYGIHGSDAEKAASRGLVELCGYHPYTNSPTRRCLDCLYGWFDKEYERGDSFISNAVVFVQKHRDHLSSLISDYGSSCIVYGRISQDSSISESNSYTKMLRVFQLIDRAWESFFFQAHSMQGTRHVDFISDLIVVLQNHRDALSQPLTNYGSACIAYGRSLQDVNDSEIHRHPSFCDIDREWMRFFVQAQLICNHYEGNKATRLYGDFGPYLA